MIMPFDDKTHDTWVSPDDSSSSCKQPPPPDQPPAVPPTHREFSEDVTEHGPANEPDVPETLPRRTPEDLTALIQDENQTPGSEGPADTRVESPVPIPDTLIPPKEGFSPDQTDRDGPNGFPSFDTRLSPPGYELLGELGRGGMGVVYKARQTALKRLVALKMILAGGHAGAQDRARFRVEAEAIARLQHPHIVQIHEVGEHDGNPFFSLEFIDGGSLVQVLSGNPLPGPRAAGLVEALARAMHFAHQRGIVHRDLKPANVLMTADGQPKITDFGLAKQLDTEDGQTHSGAVMGTPSYMAPEQAEGRVREVGPLADVYALGAILYEVLTGRAPFKGPTVLDTLEQVRTRDPLPPGRLQPGVSRDLETIALKCLAKEPARRYASAGRLADDLRRFLDGVPIQARPTPLWERGLKWARRRPAIVALLVLCILVIHGLAAAIPWHIATLRKEVRQARADESLAQNEKNRAAVRAESQQLILQGQSALDRKDAEGALLQFSLALKKLEADPALADLKPDTERRLAGARRLLAEQKESARRSRVRAQAEKKFQEFLRLRDQALFHLNRNVFVGADQSNGPRQSEQAARKALSLFEVSDKSPSGTTLADLDPRHQPAARGAYYEVLLVLAEATTRQQAADPARQARAALAILDRAAGLGLDTRAYHLRRARYLSRAGDEAAASRERKQAQEIKPVLALDDFLQGYDELVEHRDVARAVPLLQAALRLEPGHFWAQYFLAVSSLQSLTPEKAQAQLAEARAHLTVCIGQRPDFVWSHVLRGFISGELRDFQPAEADFTRALNLLDREPDPEARYVVHVNRGVMRVRQGRLNEALADLQEAAGQQPNRYHAHLNLALAYRSNQEWDKALTEMDRAIRLLGADLRTNGRDSSALAPLHRERAQIYLRRSAWKEALSDFDRAIELSGPRGRASDHLERGLILYREHRYEESVQAADNALKLRTNYALAQRLRGEALLELGKYRPAARAFDRYFEDGGKAVPEVYQARALARARLNDHRGFIDDYTRALAISQKPGLYSARGWGYLLVDAPRLALGDFEEAARFDPENARTRVGLGLTRARLGQHEKAAADADRAVKLGPRTAALLYDAARTHALCVAGALTGSPRTLQTEALARHYQTRALGFLREAIERTPIPQRLEFLRDRVLVDPAFRSLQSSPEFVRLTETVARTSR
jgi:eukaryotic-like serine/threonine-protein kinase